MLPKDRGARLSYVALGDSTVSGAGASSPDNTYVSRLHARLRAIYPEAQVTNLGVGGATSAGVVREQLRPALVLQPDLITLSAGPNDITQGRDVRAFERNLQTIFWTFNRKTHAVMVVNLLPDLAVAPRFNQAEKDVLGRLTTLFNEAIQRQARRYGVEIVDLYTPSRQEVPGQPVLLSGDDYHPSDAGYARWAELMWPGVEARLAR